MSLCALSSWYRLNSSHLSWSDFNVKVVPFVRNLDNLWPGESIDPQSVSVHQKAATAHAQHNGHAL